MPDTELFLSERQGFNVQKGQKYGNYTLTKVHATHDELVKWNQYQYVITIEAECTDKTDKNKMELFKKKFDEHLPEHMVIRTPSGRPYICWFDYNGQHSKRTKGFPHPTMSHSDDYKTLTLKYHGFAIRVSEAEASEWKNK